MSEMLQSRDQFKVERELIEKNNKLVEEINRLRKRELQLKVQLNGEQQKQNSKRGSAMDNNDVTSLLLNLDIKKNNLIKDLEEKEGGTRISNVSMTNRK